MNEITYPAFLERVKELQLGDALSTDLDLIRNNPHWASVLISDLLETAE